MSLPTVTNNINDMFKEGLLELVIDEDTVVSVGRKPRKVSINLKARYTIGVSISKKYVNIVAVDLRGNLVASQVRNIVFENSVNYYTILLQYVYRFIQLSKIDFQTVIGIGITIPGVVATNPNRIISSPELNIENENIPKSFAKHLFPVWFESKVNASGKYEIGYGSNIQNRRNLIFLSLGQFIETSLFVDGKLFIGDNGKGLQIAHSTMYPNGKKCECGKQGCVNAYLSYNYLSDDYSDFESMFDPNIQKDSKFESLIEEYLLNLLIEITNLHKMFDCEIIIGGSLVQYLISEKDKYIAFISSKTSESLDYLKFCKYPEKISAIGVTFHFISEFVSTI